MPPRNVGQGTNPVVALVEAGQEVEFPASRSEEDFPALEPWAKFWYTWVSVAFLKAYLAAAKEDPILPKDATELQVLLQVYLLEKAVYELGYELNNRPEWVKVPVQGLLQLLTVG